MTVSTKLESRWMVRKDMAQVLELELFNESPWSEDDYIKFLRTPVTIGMVFTDDKDWENVIGNFMFEMTKTKLIVIRYNFTSVQMVELFHRKMICKLHPQRRRSIDIYVAAHDLGTQIKLRELGWICGSVQYVEGEEYIFTYSL